MYYLRGRNCSEVKEENEEKPHLQYSLLPLPLLYCHLCMPQEDVSGLGDLDLWPMTLSLQLDLDTLSVDLHAEMHEMQACISVRLARIVRQTDTPDIRTQATCHPHGRVFLMCYSQSYESNFCTTNISYVWKILVNLKPKNNCNSVFSMNHQNKKSSASPEFFIKHSLPCAPWCILRLDGAYCAFLVHKYPIYRCSGV